MSSEKLNRIIKNIGTVYEDTEDITKLLKDYSIPKDFIQKYAETQMTFISVKFAAIPVLSPTAFF